MEYEEMNKAELLLELYNLKRRLKEYEDKYGPLEEEEPPYLELSMSRDEKLRVFMDYFAGRPDAIAERYISKKDGKKRYALGCLNKFDRGSGCQIEKSHCKNCAAFLPRPYDVPSVVAHMGDERHMIGIYPILEGNLVRLLVYDLDGDTFLEDAKKLRSVLYSLSVNPVLERSQSGHGIHVWIFFEEPVKAKDARMIGNYILTEAMNRHGGFGFASYDRIIPFQDQVDKGKYGNCVGLPLNKQCGEKGNTLFLNGNFEPIKRPIEYLSTIRKVSKEKVRELLEFASKVDEYGLFGKDALTRMKLSSDDFLGTVHMLFSGDVYIPLLELTERSKRFLARISSVLNKEYFKLLGARRSVYNVPKILSCYKTDDRYFRLPRGFKEDLVRLFKSQSIPYELSSALSKGEPISLSLKVSLRPQQVELLDKALATDSGIIVAPTGFGKTVLGAALLAKRGVSTLILVPSVSLLRQWIERLEEYLDVDYDYVKKPFGRLDGNGDKRNGKIDVATIQSLVRNQSFQKDARKYGMVIVDEAHHMAAFKYSEALRELAPKYLYGLTATPERSDEREAFLFQCFGPIIELEKASVPEGFLKQYHPRFTKFSSLLDGGDITTLLSELVRDKERNRLIEEDVLSAYRSGRKVLVLTERIEHALVLYEDLRKDIPRIVILYGAQQKKERERQKALLEEYGNEPFVVVSIGKYIGEGFDDDRLDALFVTYPFRWKGILAQYCGRLQRKSTAIKSVTVYDYVDTLVPALSKMYKAREKGYFELGYTLVGLDPAYSSELLSADRYDAKLSKDLTEAKTEVLFFLSFAHESRLRHLLESTKAPLSAFAKDGFTLFDHPSIITTNSPQPNLILIDGRIVYYGGINPFMYGQREDTIMRIGDPSVAKELRTSLLGNKG